MLYECRIKPATIEAVVPANTLHTDMIVTARFSLFPFSFVSSRITVPERQATEAAGGSIGGSAAEAMQLEVEEEAGLDGEVERAGAEAVSCLLRTIRHGRLRG